MGRVIIGIHGLGNKPPKDVLDEWWLRAIEEGFERLGQAGQDFRFELVYWADLLHPRPLDPDIRDEEDPLFLEEPYVHAIPGVRREPPRLRRQILEALEKILDRIMLNDDLTINYQGVADSLIHRYFKDLETYYAAPSKEESPDDPSVKVQIRERLACVLRKHQKDDILLIAHSMGTIVAYDVLDLYPELKVDTFITIGSPLGTSIVIGRIAAERHESVPPKQKRVLHTPETVLEAWHNFSDIEDKVAFNFTLADDYAGNSRGVRPVDHEVVNDYEYRGTRNPHKSYGYLRTEEFAAVLHTFLNVREMTAWERFRRGARDLWERLVAQMRPEPPVRVHPVREPVRYPPLTTETEQMTTEVRMNRDEMLKRVRDDERPWDFIVVGGGATGMGVAVEAASRGHRTLLLEQHDFGKGTSSRSTKLVHGGVRYLEQGNVSLVLEALKERAILRDNAPHLVHDLPFIVPTFDWWEGPFYGIGLRLYDLLAGKHGFGPSVNLSDDETVKRIPGIETEGLRGGVQYHDGQFDDARLLVNLAQTAVEEDAIVLNYVRVEKLVHDDDGMVDGVVAVDVESGKEFELRAHCVINATGVFTDEVRRMDDPGVEGIVQPSRGVHIVLDGSFLGGSEAIMVPHTDDGRVLFAIPWHDRVVVGTTDTPVDNPSLEPRASQEEFDFLLRHAARYLAKDPTPEDVLSIFAGLRPLVKSGNADNTAALSRDHHITISQTGLVTITGGKWTTYRRMAEDTIDQAQVIAGVDSIPSLSKDLPIHGWDQNAASYGELEGYGSDAPSIRNLMEENEDWREPLDPNLPITGAQVIWAARNEMARTVEDVLARRTRCLLLDAKASIRIAPQVARLLAGELKRKRKWIVRQVEEYTALANEYLPAGIDITVDLPEAHEEE